MSFKDIELKTEYRSKRDDIVEDFYIPVLEKSVYYRRAVGFFTSNALIEISKGITSLVKNDGKIKLIASPRLSPEDIEAMRAGYERRNQIIENALIRELDGAKGDFEKESLNLLANLIAKEVLDIKISFIQSDNDFGMYHEKMGIVSDYLGNKIAFSGSNNETKTAMRENYETLDVFCSWENSREQNRIISKEEAFDNIWSGIEQGIETVSVPNLKDELIKKYLTKPLAEEKEGVAEVRRPKNRPSIPLTVKLHDYQEEAINKWEEQGYRGIFDMATGTGKTITGLGAVVRLSEHLDDKLAVLIVCPYQHLVEQWVEDIELFGIEPIIGYSASSQRDWKKRFEKAIRSQELASKGKEFFCFISTNATFTSEFVQTQIKKISENLLLVIDEAHNFGAIGLRKSLSDNFNYRLALSATLNRHNDSDGTEKLSNYFGAKCIEYDLKRAIDEDKLTKYKYYPILTYLNAKELDLYDDLSYQIGRCWIKENGIKKLNKKGEILLQQRSRLVAGIEDKATQLEIIFREKDYLNKNNLLIYCGATMMLSENQVNPEILNEDIKQIDHITKRLGEQLQMKVTKFTANESIEERKKIKTDFENKDIQAIVAIKCLDEGVNIPSIETAFILASTTNPKEYIQRRGRVLRLYPGKRFAEIYDFISLPRKLKSVTNLIADEFERDKSLVKKELVRMKEFSALALNRSESEQSINEIKKAYKLQDEDLKGAFDNE